MLIDCDVHNTFASQLDLLPYLDEYWAQDVRRRGVDLVSSPFSTPIDVLRRDALLPDGGLAGSSPTHTLTHHVMRYGFDYAILTSVQAIGVSVHPDPDYANAIASAYNRWTADKWLASSDRYRGSIVVNHSDPAAAVKEVERWAGDRRFLQVILSTASRTPFGQRAYHPIFEACSRHGLPVALHFGGDGGGVTGSASTAGFPTRYLEWHNLLPTAYMTHLNSIVCEGVFEKFPSLRLVLIEGGVSWLPGLMWRMDKNYKALRSQTPWLKRLPSEYIREHVRLCTQPVEEPEKPDHLAATFDAIWAGETVMYSSDYPHWDFDAPDGTLTFLPAALRRRILGETAAELYGLKPRT
jgi:predicted TIM-barrel fold metal-dependent hydrolase